LHNTKFQILGSSQYIAAFVAPAIATSGKEPTYDQEA
jgi:hypothetical protein